MSIVRKAKLSLVACWLALSACGTGDDELCAPATPERIVDGLVDHACIHTEAGPFASVEAVAAGDVVATVPELRNTHTAYTIALPPGSAGRRGSVRLRPRSEGVYAFFLSADMPIVARLADQGPSVCQLEERNGNGCPRITVARSYRLARQRDYIVELGPTDAGSVMLVVEQVSSSDDL